MLVRLLRWRAVVLFWIWGGDLVQTLWLRLLFCLHDSGGEWASLVEGRGGEGKGGERHPALGAFSSFKGAKLNPAPLRPVTPHLLPLLCCRCLEAFCIYGSVGRVEEPYVSITRKKQMPRGGHSEEVEQQVGQAEGKLFTHRAAFARTSVIQAFLGSAPQLTLQLYICVLQGRVSVGRGESGSNAPQAQSSSEFFACSFLADDISFTSGCICGEARAANLPRPSTLWLQAR